MMTEPTSANQNPAPMLFHKALQKADGPIDADHVSYVIALATADDVIDVQQEKAEQDFLLLLIIDEIRRNKPQARSFKNIYQLLKNVDDAAIEMVLKQSEYWKKAPSEEFKELAMAGVQDRILEVLLADDPTFVDPEMQTV
jgi:hypothetical protein